MNDWVKVGDGLTWDYTKDKEIIGVLVAKDDSVGPNNSNLYSLKNADGSVVGVWGTALLDNRFKGIDLGEEVRILYLGRFKSEKTGREYHNFEVYHRQSESQVEGL